MKIAIHGRAFNDQPLDFIIELFQILEKEKVEVYIQNTFFKFLKNEIKIDFTPKGQFKAHADLDRDFSFFISIGGDGTFLESVDLVRDLDIPIVGINSGRLGFLANISKEQTKDSINQLLAGQFKIEERTLLALETDNHLFGEFNTALNELTISRKDTSSMITIKAYVDGQYLNSYWTDGLIISTPTGSTGYSLSVGGPIVMPGTKTFVISPIAPHNLSVRPMIIPNDKEIVLQVDGRSDSFLATLDFRSRVFDKSTELRIKKADYTIKSVKFADNDFFSTIRNKLLWGLDRRN